MGVRVLLLGVIWAVLGFVSGFPDGAPIDACVLKPEPNRPNHRPYKPLSPQTQQHAFVASGSYFEPGEIIVVYIGGPPFKGFFVQARDARTNEWIGYFDESKNSTSFVECSSVTHNNPVPKKEVYLTWRAPADYGGVVYFTGTILQQYDIFWSDLLAREDPKLREALLRVGYNVRRGFK